MSAHGGQAQAPSGWLEAREAGSVLGLRILLGIATLLGRAPLRLVLRLVVFYYALFARRARQYSQQYYAHLGQDHSFGRFFRHLSHFAQCVVDRIFFIRGQYRHFEVRTHGSEHLRQLHQKGRGAILLGAHLGSFEAMHARGDREGLRINVVGYFRNAQRINSLLEKLGPGVHARLIEARPGDIAFALRLRDCIERGEMVAILGDRVMEGRSAEVQFLGAPAKLPVGPYALAATLRCPIYLTFGLYTAPNRYELYCEPFASEISLPRKDRDRALADYAQRFADRLEHYCRLAPDNWFNFYDFWSPGD
ncbi:MAG: hypothetical protein OEZ06_28575 [Myxococcales bacterium]|nr:hypothetical protein [Myxococcales bacterium]